VTFISGGKQYTAGITQRIEYFRICNKQTMSTIQREEHARQKETLRCEYFKYLIAIL
jgi:hypothetical protein